MDKNVRSMHIIYYNILFSYSYIIYRFLLLPEINSSIYHTRILARILLRSSTDVV